MPAFDDQIHFVEKNKSKEKKKSPKLIFFPACYDNLVVQEPVATNFSFWYKMVQMLNENKIV